MPNRKARLPTRVGTSDDGGEDNFTQGDHITQALRKQQWFERLICLMDALKTESSDMLGSSRATKAFARLRGLCTTFEALKSFNTFEREYHNTECRIKSERQDLDHSSSAIFGFVVDEMFDQNSQSDSDSEEAEGETKPDGDDINSPKSNSTVIRPYDQGLGRRTRTSQYHPSLDNMNSPFSHYCSPSLLDSPSTTRLEAFSPMLSPVRESKNVEDSSVSSTPMKGELVSPLLSPYESGLPINHLGGSGTAPRKKTQPVPVPGSQNSIASSGGSRAQGKALSSPPFPSPLVRNFSDEAPEDQGSNEPPGLEDGSLLESHRKFRIYSPRTSFSGNILAQSPFMKDCNDFAKLRDEYLVSSPKKLKVRSPKGFSLESTFEHQPSEEKHFSGARTSTLTIDADRGSSESESPIQISSFFGIQEPRRGLEGTKDNCFTTAPESSVTPPRVSQSIDQEQLSNSSIGIATSTYETPGEVNQLSAPLQYDSDSKFSITSSLLSYVEGKGKSRARKGIQRESSGSSTISSTASHTPKLATKVYLKRPRDVPRIVLVKKDASGRTIFVPEDEDRERQLKVTGSASAGGVTSTLKSSGVASSLGEASDISDRARQVGTRDTPLRIHSSGTLPITSNRPSGFLRLPFSGRKSGVQTLPSQRHNKSVDTLMAKMTAQDLARRVTVKDSGEASQITPTVINFSKRSTNIPEIVVDSQASSDNLLGGNDALLGSADKSRTVPIISRNWFGQRSTLELASTLGPMNNSVLHIDSQKENSRPFTGNAKLKTGSLGGLTNWFNSTKKFKGKSSLLPPNGNFSLDEVDDLIKRLSAQDPDEKDGLSALGGRYYSSSIPSLEKSPSKDEKGRNPIAVCMDLINAASNEPQSHKRENLLQMSRVMVDAVTQSRDAECAAEQAEISARKAEMAFLETKKHLAQITELVKHKKGGI